MSFYSTHILPTLTDLAMRNKAATGERARWVPLATGEVLEVGAGSGLNFRHYGSGVRTLYALELGLDSPSRCSVLVNQTFVSP